MAEWRNGVMPWLDGLLWMYAAAALTFLQCMLGGKLRYLKPVAGLAALLMAGYGGLFWWNTVKGPANVDQGVWWTGSIDYRRWVGPLAVPFFLLVTAEVFLRAGGQKRNCRRQGRAHRRTIVGRRLARGCSFAMGECALPRILGRGDRLRCPGDCRRR